MLLIAVVGKYVEVTNERKFSRNKRLKMLKVVENRWKKNKGSRKMYKTFVKNNKRRNANGAMTVTGNDMTFFGL